MNYPAIRDFGPTIPSVENPITKAEPLRPIRGDLAGKTRADRIVDALRTHGPLDTTALNKRTGIATTDITSALNGRSDILIERHEVNGKTRRFLYLDGQDVEAYIEKFSAGAQTAQAPIPAPAPTPAAPRPSPAAAAPRPASKARFGVWSDGTMTITDGAGLTLDLGSDDMAELVDFIQTIKPRSAS